MIGARVGVDAGACSGSEISFSEGGRTTSVVGVGSVTTTGSGWRLAGPSLEDSTGVSSIE